MIPLVLAIISGVLFGLDFLLWHTVDSYKSRALVSIAGVLLAVAVIVMASEG